MTKMQCHLTMILFYRFHVCFCNVFSVLTFALKILCFDFDMMSCSCWILNSLFFFLVLSLVFGCQAENDKKREL